MDYQKFHINPFRGVNLSLRKILTCFAILTLGNAAKGSNLCQGKNVCANRNCYVNAQQCNGKDDCGDGSDEWDCDILDRFSKSGNEDEIAWPWWILIVSALIVVLTCLAVVCRYLRERTDPALDAYLLDSPSPRRGGTRLTSHDNPRQIELRDTSERSHRTRNRPQGRKKNQQKQVPPPIPPPPRLAQNSAQSTLVSDDVIASPPQHLNSAVAVDIEPLPPPPQPTRTAPPVPQSPTTPIPTANKRRRQRSRTPENLIDQNGTRSGRVRSRPEVAPRSQPNNVEIPIVPPPPTTPTRPQQNQQNQPQQQQQVQAQQHQQNQTQQQQSNPLQNETAVPPPAYEDLQFDGYRTLQVDQSSAAARGEERPARQRPGD